MPSPQFGHKRKHANHLALLARMMEDRLPDRLRQAPSLAAVYERLLRYSGLGPFLAYQYAIDLNYSDVIDFDESDFVVAGPGALDGIAKCFADTGRRSASSVIAWMVEHQDSEFGRLGLSFQRLHDRPLQLIDCQNLFCEISKYARLAHPHALGLSQRTRIKQLYRHDPTPSDNNSVAASLDDRRMKPPDLIGMEAALMLWRHPGGLQDRVIDPCAVLEGSFVAPSSWVSPLEKWLWPVRRKLPRRAFGENALQGAAMHGEAARRLGHVAAAQFIDPLDMLPAHAIGRHRVFRKFRLVMGDGHQGVVDLVRRRRAWRDSRKRRASPPSPRWRYCRSR